MQRRRLTAADYIERHDEWMRACLGVMAEHAARISVLWNIARRRTLEHPEEVLSSLLEAEVILDEYIQFGAPDCMRKIRAAVNRLEAEWPEGRARTKPLTVSRSSDAVRGDRRN